MPSSTSSTPGGGQTPTPSGGSLPIYDPSAPVVPSTPTNTVTPSTSIFGPNGNGSGFVTGLVSPPTIPSTISSSSLSHSTPTPVIQPTVAPPNTSALAPTTPPLTETPEEQQQSDLSKQLEQLTTTDASKAAFTTDQQSKAGVGTLQSSLADLQGQLTSLQAQAKAIPLQDTNNGIGRMGTGGIAAQDTINLRTNAIQALNISAQIDATNGLLASANQKVTDAVNAQYGPIEAQMAALQANLKNIANDPQTSIDDKNRAQAQVDAVAKQQAAIAAQKQEQTDIWNVATSAASNAANFTPTPDYPTVAVALKAIQNAPDKATALTIATQTGLASSQKNSSSIQDIGGRKVQIVTDSNGKIISKTDLGSSATYSELNPSPTKQAGYTSFTPTQQLDLQKAGETAASITQLEKDVNQYGPQYVLDNGQGLSSATKQWIQATYSVSPTVQSKSNGIFGLGILGL